MRLGPELTAVHAAEASATVAGARTFALARESALFLGHFEHTAWVDLPPAWELPDRPDLGEVRPWEAGVLAETKFRHFRLDRMVGSYHPGQRAAWTAHELAHKLVGWAWWPGITRLELATCARVAEALPVALWYFFDEAGRRRCPVHDEVDAWGATYCAACEAAAAAGPRPPDAHDAVRIADGWRFLERELAAAGESLRVGAPVPTPWRRVDLCSDGLAWASAHAPRLDDARSRRWLTTFVRPGEGHHASFAALVARVQEVAAAIVEGAALARWSGGAADWVLQDAAQRVTQVAALVDGEAGAALDGVLTEAARDRRVEGLVHGYAEVAAAYELPAVQDVFAVGYAVPGVDRAPGSLGEALVSGFPHTTRLWGEAGVAAAAQVLHDEDDWGRVRFVRRARSAFAAAEPRLRQLAAVEAALADAPAVDLAALALAPDVGPDDALGLGAVELADLPTGWRRALRGGGFGRDGAATVAVLRGADNAAAIVELSPAASALARGEGSADALSPDERGMLVGLGVFVRSSPGGARCRPASAAVRPVARHRP